jgi:Autoinducer binding domain
MTPVHDQIPTLLSGLRAARSDGDVTGALERFAHACGFAHFQLAPGPQNPSSDPTALLAFGSFPDSLRRRYATERACAGDPARASAIQRAGPVHWRRVHGDVRDPAQRAHVADLRALGLRDGVTAPVHGPQGCVAVLMLAASRLTR